MELFHQLKHVCVCVCVCDNVAFARKFVQDALVRCGVLKNDGWAQVENFTDAFSVDKKNPRVEVRFEEVKP